MLSIRCIYPLAAVALLCGLAANAQAQTVYQKVHAGTVYAHQPRVQPVITTTTTTTSTTTTTQTVVHAQPQHHVHHHVHHPVPTYTVYQPPVVVHQPVYTRPTYTQRVYQQGYNHGYRDGRRDRRHLRSTCSTVIVHPGFYYRPHVSVRVPIGRSSRAAVFLNF
ncbi:MAG: hypothetical protein EA402_00140 [Planctomycetota bacterium]|nr:MAG: hypothetical protein EA402_00140 [Planctomycetota bacterium]